MKYKMKEEKIQKEIEEFIEAKNEFIKPYKVLLTKIMDYLVKLLG